MKKPTRDAEASKTALIAAGEMLFARDGFKGVTVDMLASASGVNRALISYYFGSKEGLYDAIIEKLVTDTVNDVRSGLSEHKDPVMAMRDYISGLGRAFANRQALGAILLREYMGGRMQERKKPFNNIFKFYQMTEEIYQKGRRSKRFRKLDPHQLHLSIIAPLVHFVITAGFRERALAIHAPALSNPALDDFITHHANLILRGIACDKAKS